jgi:hypothetical protein
MTGSGGQDNIYDDLKANVEELRKSNQELKDRMVGIEQETLEKGRRGRRPRISTTRRRTLEKPNTRELQNTKSAIV